MTGQLILAIDGGNSKTDVLLADTAGAVHAYVRGPGSSPQTLGVDTALGILGKLVRSATSRAGSTVLPVRAEVYLSGVDLPEEAAIVSKAVAGAGWAREYRVDNDTFALLRLGLSESTAAPDAVAVVCGAGINCVGRRADGRTARFRSLGPLSGDWGGGQHLAGLALWHAARAEDGRGPATELIIAVAAHCGVATIGEVIAGIHLGAIPRTALDDLSVVLFAVADGGDDVARRVVARQAQEIVLLTAAAAGKLDLLDKPYTVVLGGSVLRAGHALLNDAVADGVLARSPRAELSLPGEPPVLGAALLGFDALGIDGAPVQALRDAVRAAAPVDSAAATGRTGTS